MLVEHDGVEPPGLVVVDRCEVAARGDEQFGVVGGPARLDGLGLPMGIEAFVFHLGLVASGGEHGRLPARGRVRGAGGGEPGFDLIGPLRERIDEVAGDTGDLVDVTARHPLDTERRGEFGSEGGLEDLASSLGIAEEVGVDDGRPLAVAALGHVGDEAVPVQERVAGAGGAMPERRGDHA